MFLVAYNCLVSPFRFPGGYREEFPGETVGKRKGQLRHLYFEIMLLSLIEWMYQSVSSESDPQGEKPWLHH